MKEDQDNIFYLAGENIDSLKNSPYLEQLQKEIMSLFVLKQLMNTWYKVSKITKIKN